MQRQIIASCLNGERKAAKPDWQPRYMAFPMKTYTKRGGAALTSRAASHSKTPSESMTLFLEYDIVILLSQGKNMSESHLERMTVTVTPEMAGAMRAALEGGAYASNSEIVREALRDWRQRQLRESN